MIYSVILGDMCYEPRLEIADPSKLEGWSASMGVPYWVLGFAYNGGAKWRASRKDRCSVEGEGGFWMGAVEGAEFFIQDVDFDFDPRFDEGLHKYNWKERKKDKVKVKVDPSRYYYQNMDPGTIANRPLGWAEAVQPAVAPAPLPEGWLEVPMPNPQPVAAPPPARNRIREALEGAAARALNWAPAPIAQAEAAAGAQLEAAYQQQLRAADAAIRQRVNQRPAYQLDEELAPGQLPLPDEAAND